MNDCQFPWIILVPRQPRISEIYQLDTSQREQLQLESHLISKALMDYFRGDKLNVAALGNMVPQLHLHHIVRFIDDSVWPKPVWGNIKAKPYQADELETRLVQLRKLFSI